ncbi:MAG: UDP-N-acetylmuramate dehydrogenase [Clostridia bacterium]
MLLDRLHDAMGKELILTDEPMSRHTSFRTGGSCDIMVLPKTLEDIRRAVDFCRQEKIKPVILGNCTNVLVSDKGIRGICIKISKGFDGITVEGKTLTAEAGSLLSHLARTAYEHGLEGLEFASGIPGTTGGGVCMNAGAYGPEIKDVLVSTTYMDPDGSIHSIGNADHGFSYRKSVFSIGESIILNSVFRLEEGDKETIRTRMLDLNGRRMKSQPLDLPSAGSVFKRPQGYFAGRLIEECQLKGHCVNGAAVSHKHAGFIVNLKGDATSGDVKRLIDDITDRVYNKFGVLLETEIKYIGEW